MNTQGKSHTDFLIAIRNTQTGYLSVTYNNIFLVFLSLCMYLDCRCDAVRSALCDSTVFLTTGEHEYTRYGFRQLTTAGCVDILQVNSPFVFLVTV